MSKMTVRECMDAALQLLNQYSIAGTLVPLSYNDQADTEARMINLINDAQMEIATTVKNITAYLTFSVPVIPDNEPLQDITQEMPDDFNHVIGLYFTPINGRNRTTVDASMYKWIGEDVLLIPNRPAGTYGLEYNRYPVRLSTAMTDAEKASTTLDNTPDTHEIIPYFVAAMIAVDENPKMYYALYNVWETRLARLGKKPAHATINPVADVYGFDNFRGLL